MGALARRLRRRGQRPPGRAGRGGPDGGPGSPSGWAADPAAAVGLTLAVAPATWCARLFAVRARRVLATSRGLEEFTGCSRPLLLGAVALFLAVLAAILLTGRPAYGHGSFASAAAPGALLFLARLLTLHGFAPAAAAGLRAAACAEAPPSPWCSPAVCRAAESSPAR
ncbi:hypothetical protein [Streptomyces sp. BPTC-684]|uniref:hypothetical protein n=1 Tax=Streptomyces sp. BPTC-684 TaxID=3043734 RepID=UPI0024B20CE3|nr:hypothetical protein [Streptomyces sp. BPTC-684]WHM36743.1 hypothetical protein QIY60_07475 [Streptomyces sp. BPTC-684]